MQGRLKSALRSAALVSGIAVSSFVAVPPGGAAPATDNCLTTPNSAAPQGSHWYYRLERGTQRKCWRLVKKDQKEQNAAAKIAPQPEGDDDENDAAPAPAPVVNAPAARVPAAIMPPARSALPAPSTSMMDAAPPASAPPVRNLVTRNVSNSDDLIQPAAQAPAPSAESATPADVSAAPAPAEPAAAPQPVPTPAPTAAQPPVQPVAAPQPIAADAPEMPTLKLLLLAIAITGFLAGLIFFAMELVRRRSDVLNRAHDDDPQGVPYEPSPDMVYDTPSVSPPEEKEARPTFEPIPALRQVGEQEPDSIEEALRRMHSRRRRAA